MRQQGTGFMHNGAQLFSAQVLVARLVDIDAEQTQKAVGNAVDEPYQRVSHLEHGLQQIGGGKGDAFGMQRCQGFGRNFGKNQDDQGQTGRGNGDTGVAPEADGNDGSDGGCQNVDEVVTDQNQADQSIRSLQQTVGLACTAVAAFDQVTQSVAVEGHHPGFGAGKKCRAKNQQDQNASECAYRRIVQGT